MTSRSFSLAYPEPSYSEIGEDSPSTPTATNKLFQTYMQPLKASDEVTSLGAAAQERMDLFDHSEHFASLFEELDAVWNPLVLLLRLSFVEDLILGDGEARPTDQDGRGRGAEASAGEADCRDGSNPSFCVPRSICVNFFFDISSYRATSFGEGTRGGAGKDATVACQG